MFCSQRSECHGDGTDRRQPILSHECCIISKCTYFIAIIIILYYYRIYNNMYKCIAALIFLHRSSHRLDVSNFNPKTTKVIKYCFPSKRRFNFRPNIKIFSSHQCCASYYKVILTVDDIATS